MLSEQLYKLTKSNKCTLADIISQLGNQAYMVIAMLLMSIPALPLPTGGITHLFEVIAIFICIQLLIGKTYIWLPKKWLAKSLPDKFWSYTLPKIAAFSLKIERTRPKAKTNSYRQFIIEKLLIVSSILFALFALFAPPFSGLDTLPSLGFVIIYISLLTGNYIVSILGVITGATGVVLELIIGKMIINYF